MKMLNKSIHSLLITVLFVVLLFIISSIFQGLGQLFMEQDPYKMPHGHAVKVFQQGEGDTTSPSMFQRLAIFYLYGEN